MPNNAGVYWDACVFIDRMQRRGARIGVLEAITDAAAAGDFLIVTSAVTLCEVIKLPQLGIMPDEQTRTVADFFDNPWISVRIVDEVIAKAAAELRRSHGLKTCDAIHVATALRYQVPVMHTYDGLLLAFDQAFGDTTKLRVEFPSDLRPPKPVIPQNP